VTALLRTLAGQRRQTIVMVTHDRGVAAHADRLICLCDGLIESDNEQTPVDHSGIHPVVEEHRQ
jgi:ABC-type lipoprotein export system ATPase subunit